MKKMTAINCDECGTKLIEKDGSYVCPHCGLVHEPVLTASSYNLGSPIKSSKRIFNYTAVNNELSLIGTLGSSIGTIEEYFFKDNRGMPLNEKKQEKFRKFKAYYHRNSALKGKETDFRTLKIMREVFARLNLPSSVTNRALFLYRKYKKQFNKEITNHVVLSAVVIFIATRENKHNSPISLKEIVETYRALGHRVKGKNLLKLLQDLKITKKVDIRRSEDYVFRVCSLICNDHIIKSRIVKKYGLEPYVFEKLLQLLSFKILERIPYKDRGGRRPYSFSAAVAYVGDKLLSKKMGMSSVLTQRLVATTVNVGEFTIREHAEFIYKYSFDDIISEISEHLSSAIKDKRS